MKRIALTGGIACGKSTLAGFLSELGCEVLDTDAVTHAMESPGGEAVGPILAAFGPGVRGGDGGIDRKRLGRLVFDDPAAREKLNGILHPRVRSVMDRWLREPSGGPRVAIVPLLFEAGWDEGWDAVVCVTCSAAEQVRRLRDRGLTEEEARSRMEAQLPVEVKMRRASHVVDNSAGSDALRREAQRLMQEFSERRI
jgi:dephospho-CoA kinase